MSSRNKKTDNKELVKNVNDFFDDIYNNPYFPPEQFTKEQEALLSDITEGDKVEKRKRVSTYFKRNSGAFKKIREQVDKMFEDHIVRTRLFLTCVMISETEIYTSNFKGLVERYKEWVSMFHKNHIPNTLQILITKYINESFGNSEYYEKIEKIMEIWGWHINKFINFTLESSWVMRERMFDIPQDYEGDEEEEINLQVDNESST